MRRSNDALAAPLNLAYTRLINEKAENHQQSEKPEKDTKKGEHSLTPQYHPCRHLPPLLSCRRIWKIADLGKNRSKEKEQQLQLSLIP